MAAMEAKLRVIIDDRIEMLVLPTGIPPTLVELQTVITETFGIKDFSIQYLDPEFKDYFTLNRTDQIQHKDTIKIVQTPVFMLTLRSADESFASTSSQQTFDLDSVTCEASTSSDIEFSVGSSIAQDTNILSSQSTTGRCQPWPKQFPIPHFAYETELCLERATEDYKKDGKLLTTSKVKADILEKLAEAIYTYTAYPSREQISDVAEALVNKYPCLKEPTSFSGVYGWQQSLKYKMANYRTKLRSFGVPEVLCNAINRKKPADRKSAKCVKKPRKAELNYLPPYPTGENEESQENKRIQLLTEVSKRDNNKLIREKMAKTFAHRRHEIINQSPSIGDIKARWPALFDASHLQDEFHRITTVHLESKFMSKLDEYTPRLLTLFQSKGGSMGLRIQGILLKLPSNPNINMIRDAVLRCLLVYLGEVKDGLFKEYNDHDGESVFQDLSLQKMIIFQIQTITSESPDVGIVVDGVTVLNGLQNFPRACAMFVGLTYALDLAYPKELKYTMEVFQKLFLELDCLKLSPKVNSLKAKLHV